MGSKINWQKEFTEFAASEAAEVPSGISELLVAQVRSDLHPGLFLVFTKVALIHTLVGAMTLLACPQFGISLTGNHGLMPYLMQYGENICMLGCGAFFTALSLLAASLLLRPEEVRVFKGNQILQLASLATYSIGAFLFLGGEVVVALALIWSLGAILGGALMLEAGWACRKFFAQRRLT
jgi:hypothetical protein